MIEDWNMIFIVWHQVLHSPHLLSVSYAFFTHSLFNECLIGMFVWMFHAINIIFQSV